MNQSLRAGSLRGAGRWLGGKRFALARRRNIEFAGPPEFGFPHHPGAAFADTREPRSAFHKSQLIQLDTMRLTAIRAAQRA
jgi:hypothetical protein